MGAREFGEKVLCGAAGDEPTWISWPRASQQLGIKHTIAQQPFEVAFPPRIEIDAGLIEDDRKSGQEIRAEPDRAKKSVLNANKRDPPQCGGGGKTGRLARRPNGDSAIARRGGLQRAADSSSKYRPLLRSGKEIADTPALPPRHADADRYSSVHRQKLLALILLRANLDRRR